VLVSQESIENILGGQDVALKIQFEIIAESARQMVDLLRPYLVNHSVYMLGHGKITGDPIFLS
jgi:hypothetical protein